MSSTLAFAREDRAVHKGKEEGAFCGHVDEEEQHGRFKRDGDGSCVVARVEDLENARTQASKKHLHSLVKSPQDGFDLSLSPEATFSVEEIKESLQELSDQVNEFAKHQLEK